MSHKLTKYLFFSFALIGLLAVLALSSHSVTAADAHLDQDGWEWHYDTAYPGILTSVVQTGGSTEINIPTNLDGITALTNIANSAFNDVEGHKITKVLSMPNTTVSIGVYSFVNCASLTYIQFGTGLTTIGYGAFQNSALTNMSYLGFVAPGTVAADWIAGTPGGLLGHAYHVSDFPATGASWNGLVMGTYLAPPVLTFTSSPIRYSYQFSNYDYHMMSSYNASYSLTTTYGEIYLGASNHTLYGVTYSTGIYPVSVRITDVYGSVTYQNYSLSVILPNPSSSSLSPEILLALGLLAILTLMAIYIRDVRPFAGVAWVVLPLTTMLSYGIPVILITVIIGIVLIYLWAVD